MVSFLIVAVLVEHFFSFEHCLALASVLLEHRVKLEITVHVGARARRVLHGVVEVDRAGFCVVIGTTLFKEVVRGD